MKRFVYQGLFLAALCFSSAYGEDSAPGTRVTWSTADGVRLVGEYFPAAQRSATTWIFLHGLGSNRGEWRDFSRRLQAQGDGAFIYDARGHFDSSHRTNGGKIQYQDFRTAGPGSNWDAMISDLGSAVAVLHKRFGLPKTQVAVAGASVGANVALLYAAHHADVPALILLSPGFNYAGLESEDAYIQYGPRPVFLAASPGDAYAYQTVQHLASLRSARVEEGVGAEHGVNMFKEESFTVKLLDWIKETDKTIAPH